MRELEHQFYRGSQPDLRAYRTFLDVLGACENLPLALISNTTQGNYLRVSSFSAPLFELLRGREWFLAHEWELVSNALREQSPSTDEPIQITYTACFEARVVSYLLPTRDPAIFVMCGPVWLRDPQTLREPFKRKFVEKAARHIIDSEERYLRAEYERRKADSGERHNEPSDRSLSTERVKRMLQHRAAISESDLVERVKIIRQVLTCMMRGAAPVILNADQIERVALALCFWARNTQHLGGPPSGCRLIQSADDPGNPDNLLFVLEHSPGFVPPFKFSIQEKPDGSTDEQLFLRNPVSEQWSHFSDTYRNNRNVYFLERILLIRLWLQDNFSGIAADNDADGGQTTRTLLIELMRILQTILGADACILYRYIPGETIVGWKRGTEPISGTAREDQRSGFLRRQAYHYAPDSTLERTSIDEARNMMAIGAKSDRSSSIAYRALDEKKTLYDPDASKESLSWSSTGDVPRTILATPLISRGCAWGVIEIIGSSAYQFPYSSIRWVEELSRILTPILFDHWLTFRLREISRIAMAPSRNPLSTPTDIEEDKYEQVLDHVRKLLMASSARLYLQRATRTREFVRRAHVGQDWPPEVAESFELGDVRSVSAITIQEMATWSTGIIGRGVFAEAGGRPGPLQRHGHRGCAIIPIYNGNRNCFATVVITSTDNSFEKSMWDGTVQAISKNLNVVLEAIHLQETRVEARQTYFAHTIKTRAKRVQSGGEHLISLLSPLVGRPRAVEGVHQFTNEVEALNSLANRQGARTLSPESVEILQALRATFPAPTHPDSKKTSLPDIVGDLRAHLQEMHKSVVFIAGGPNAEDPREADPETWDGTRPDLRLCILQSLKPLEKGERVKTNIHAPDRSVLPLGVRVRLPQHILVEILNNLVDNAIKYDFSPPSSTLRVLSKDDYYTIEFRNLAPRVPQNEARRLREFGGYRSKYARSKNRDGSGVGLRFIKDLAIAWGFDFAYNFPLAAAREPDSYGWHSLKLGFNVTVDFVPSDSWKGPR